jgi:hypothetical protein
VVRVAGRGANQVRNPPAHQISWEANDGTRTCQISWHAIHRRPVRTVLGVRCQRMSDSFSSQSWDDTGWPVAARVGRFLLYPCARPDSLASDMPTPAQQKEYWRLSDILIAITQRFYRELPNGAVSLALTNEGRVSVDVYDNNGKVIGTIPNDTTTSAFRADLERAFAGITLPDENLIVFVHKPTSFTAKQ